jgi:type IV secretion system protein VirB6
MLYIVRSYFLLLIFVAVILFAQYDANAKVTASSPWIGCTQANDFEDAVLQATTYELSPFSAQCENDCNTACQVFSRKDTVNAEINPDGIQRCISACRGGNDYIDYIYEMDTSVNPPKLRAVGPIQSPYKCTGLGYSISNAPIYTVATGLYKNDRVKILMHNTNADGTGAKIYMCGKMTTVLRPIMNSIVDADWEDATTPPKNIPNKNSTVFTAKMDASQWASFSNKKVWFNSDYDRVDTNFLGMNKVVSQPFVWSARQLGFTGSNIVAKDGDELNISWTGNFIGYPRITGADTFHKLYVASKNPAAYETAFTPDLDNPNAAAAINSAIRSASTIMIDYPGYKFGYPQSSLTSDYIVNYFPIYMMQLNGITESPAGTYTINYGATNVFGLYNRSILSEGATRLIGEDFRTTTLGVISKPDFSVPPPAPKQIFGLKGFVLDQSAAYAVNTTSSDCNTEEKRAQNPDKCVSITDVGQPLYMLQGQLSGFSPTPLALRFSHDGAKSMANLVARAYNNSATIDSSTSYNIIPDANYNTPPFPEFSGKFNNLGGHTVTVSYSGCPIEGGEGLQYMFSATKPGINDSGWQDLKDTDISGGYLTANVAGNLYMKFKEPAGQSTVLPPTSAPPALTATTTVNTSPIAQAFYYDLSSRYGKYTMEVKAPNNVSKVGGAIYTMVNTVREVLFGPNGDSGVVKTLYEALFEQSQVIGIVNAVLILYLCMFALGFLIGTVQLQQQEVIVRIVKFAFVAAIISPGSWDFFFNFFLSGFINGGIELIGIVVSGGLQNITLGDIQRDPSLAFSVFDKGLTLMFSASTWNRMIALIVTSVFGILIALLIFISIICYTLALVKATVQFLMSMVIISVLILTAPIFMCCMLFETTKQMFDSWWKYFFSFTLQPVAIFAAISILNFLILTTLMLTLGFTICPYCMWGISDPVSGTLYCLIPSWRMPIHNVLPGGVTLSFYTPIGTFQGALILVILCKATMDFTSFIPKIINVMVTGTFQFATNLSAYGTTAVDKGLSVVGMDKASRQMSRGR